MFENNSEDKFLDLLVDQNGQTCWQYRSEFNINSTIYPCSIRKSVESGLHIVSNRTFRRGDKVLEDFSLVAVPYGPHSNRICWACLQHGHSKVKVFPNIPSLYFCSMKCLQETEHFVDMCGKLLVRLASIENSEQSHLLHLAVKVLYLRAKSCTGVALHSFGRVVCHEQHRECPVRGLETAVDILFNGICSDAPFLLSWCSVDRKAAIVEEVLRSVHFNAQSCPVPHLLSSGLLCVFDTLSRMNHSCDPNTVVCTRVERGIICGSIVALRSLKSGEEITMSYLSQLCLPVSERRELLLSAFLFTCQCQRCSAESSITSKPSADIIELQTNARVDGRNLVYVADSLEKLIREARCKRGAQVYAIHDVTLYGMEQLTRGAEKLATHTAMLLTIRFASILVACWDISGIVITQPSQIVVLMAAANAARQLMASKLVEDVSNHISTGRSLAKLAVLQLSMLCNTKSSSTNGEMHFYSTLRMRAMKLLSLLSQN